MFKFFILSCILLFIGSSISHASPPEEEIKALCDLANLTGCMEDCRKGCRVCGASCSMVEDHITEISATGVPIGTLPDSFANLKSLKRINFWLAQLIEIPEYFGNFSNLTSLNIGGNLLTELPTSLASLSLLNTIYIDLNNFSSFPDVVLQMNALERLIVKDNVLTQLPDGFGNLHKLRELDLTNNEVVKLPGTFGHLSSLQSLSLGKNLLSDIPVAMSNFSLSYLDIKNNLLRCDKIKANSSYSDIIKTSCNSSEQRQCRNLTTEKECLLSGICSYTPTMSPSCYPKDGVIPHCAQRAEDVCITCEFGYLPSARGEACCIGPNRCVDCDLYTGVCSRCFGGFITLNNTCEECPNKTWSKGNETTCHDCVLGPNCVECDSTKGNCSKCIDGYTLSSGCKDKEIDSSWLLLLLTIPVVLIPVIVISFLLFYRKYQNHQADKEQRFKHEEEERSRAQASSLARIEEGSTQDTNKELQKPLLQQQPQQKSINT